MYVIIDKMTQKSRTRKPPAHTKQYERNERAIQSAIRKLLKTYRGHITARQVAKAAGLTRQTVYNHHPNINRAISENEHSLLTEFSITLEGQAERLRKVIKDANGRLFFSLLVFIAKHKETFGPICADVNNQGLLHSMVETVYPRLEVGWLPKGSPAPALDSERASMLVCMVVNVVNRWGRETECNVRRAGHYMARLQKIVDEAGRNRLP